MKKRRIFIAINPPENIKDKLLEYRDKWRDMPARWASKDNFHITLNFLGYISDEELIDVIKTVEQVALKHDSFSVKLNKICYGPDGKMPPRMIWVEGERSEELSALKNDLDKALDTFENRGFSPHITLARIKTWALQRMEPEEISEINEDIDLNFSVNSIEVMESVLKRGGAEYTILESFNLK